MNMVGLPACPRGNSASYKILLRNYGEDLSEAEFAFIVNQDLSGRIPPVLIRWRYLDYMDLEPEPEPEEPEPEEPECEEQSQGEYEYDCWDECEEEYRRANYTYLIVPSWLTAGLEPGAYYFNINIRYPDRRNYIRTILAGTWPILPVPGLMWDSWVYDYGAQWRTAGWTSWGGRGSWKSPGWTSWNSPGWRPQLLDQFPPQVPRRFYAY